MKKLLPLLPLVSAFLVIHAAEAAAEPKLHVSRKSVEFPEGGVTSQLGLENRGNADLVVYGFQVLEEGFGKRKGERQVDKAFKLDRAETETFVLKPGATPVTVSVEYRPDGRQKQAF